MVEEETESWWVERERRGGAERGALSWPWLLLTCTEEAVEEEEGRECLPVEKWSTGDPIIQGKYSSMYHTVYTVLYSSMYCTVYTVLYSSMYHTVYTVLYSSMYHTVYTV